MLTLTQRIDRLPQTTLLKQVLILAGIGWLFDAMDQGMVAGVMAAIGKEWLLTPHQLGLLGSSGMLGMAVGAALSGMAADRFGRKTVITYTLVIFGVASGLAAFSTNFTMLLVFRFLTGLGLGGELPAASTLVSEFAPARMRGRYVVLLESFWAWGWILASLVAYLLIPVYGWRAAFLVGAVPALAAAVLRMYLPESPRYLEMVGRWDAADLLVTKMEKQADMELAPAEKATASDLGAKTKTQLRMLWSKKYVKRTFVLWVIWFGINFGYYGFVLWTPTLLVGKGFALVKSFEFTLIMCLAQVPGYFSAAWLIEKIGRKKVLALYFAGTALAAWLFGHAGSPTQVVVYGSLLYFFALGAWGCVYAYTPEVYPTSVRGSGTGWAAAFGRLGAFTAPFIVPVVYEMYGTKTGYTNVFIMLMAVFLFVAVIVFFFGEETAGKTLEDINQ